MRAALRGRALAWLCALVPAALPASVAAHDSWLAPAAGPAEPRLLRLELGAGPRYPARDSAVPAASVQRAACRTASGGRPEQVALVARLERPQFLELRARLDTRQPVACWAELRPHEVVLTPELVGAYLDEVRAPEAVRQAWARQQARGLPWRESYRKFLRIELPPAGDGTADAGRPGDVAALRASVGMGLELVPLGGEPVRAGQQLTVQALLDGQPAPGLPVELVSERHALGIWRQTDTQGRVQVALPFGGQWLARAVRLEAPASDAEPWRSRFATLVLHAR